MPNGCSRPAGGSSWPRWSWSRWRRAGSPGSNSPPTTASSSTKTIRSFLALEALENTYGKNENVAFLIVPEDGDATSRIALSAAVWLTEAAWQTPYSRRVDSLANFQHTTADGDDLYVRDLVDPQELDEAEARSRIRAVALSDPRIAGSILALDGDVSVVSVTVELPEEGLLEAVAEVAEFARSVAAQAEERFPGIDLRVVGTVMINQTFVEASISSQMIFLPASLLLMAPGARRAHPGLGGGGGDRGGHRLFHSRLAGRWRMARPAVFPARLAGTHHRADDRGGELRSPAGGVQQGLRSGKSRHDAIVESVSLNLHPVFLASLTTALGFLSMNFSEVPPYRDLGNFVAIGIVASFLLSVTFLPALLSLLPVRAPKQRRVRVPTMRVLAESVLRHRKAIIWDGWWSCP